MVCVIFTDNDDDRKHVTDDNVLDNLRDKLLFVT